MTMTHGQISSYSALSEISYHGVCYTNIKKKKKTQSNINTLGC